MAADLWNDDMLAAAGLDKSAACQLSEDLLEIGLTRLAQDREEIEKQSSMAAALVLPHMQLIFKALKDRRVDVEALQKLLQKRLLQEDSGKYLDEISQALRKQGDSVRTAFEETPELKSLQRKVAALDQARVCTRPASLSFPGYSAKDGKDV